MIERQANTKLFQLYTTKLSNIRERGEPRYYTNKAKCMCLCYLITEGLNMTESHMDRASCTFCF